jgi:hypothetical protein
MGFTDRGPLNVDGNTIPDKELSGYIVVDIRLLMVGNVLILDKWVIEEVIWRAAKVGAVVAKPTGK